MPVHPFCKLQTQLAMSKIVDSVCKICGEAMLLVRGGGKARRSRRRSKIVPHRSFLGMSVLPRFKFHFVAADLSARFEVSSSENIKRGLTGGVVSFDASFSLMEGHIARQLCFQHAFSGLAVPLLD